MGKNRMIYGIVVVVLFIFIYLRDSAMTYTAFYAALVMPLISYGLAVLTRKNVVAKTELVQTFVKKNEPSTYKVTISNNGFLPCFFACAVFDFESLGLESEEKQAFFSLKPFGTFENEAMIRGKYRGVYDVGVKNLYVYDFLGLFRLRTAGQDTTKLIIAPNVITVPAFTAEITTQGETVVKRHMKGHDYSQVPELRQYQLTDSYKQIHWKASAKRQELISKDPQEIEQLATVFFINNRRILKSLELTLSREDKMIDMVVSAMSHCHQLGHRMSMHTLTWANPIFTTDFTRLYHDVSALSFEENGEIHQVLNGYLNTGQVLENIFVFTQEMDRYFIESVQGFKYIGSNVTVFLFGHAPDSQLRKLQSLGIHCLTFE